MNLLEASISASFMILGLLLIRKIGKKYISKTAITNLWNLVLLKTLLPFQIPLNKIPILNEFFAGMTLSNKISVSKIPIDVRGFKSIPIETSRRNENLNRVGQIQDYLLIIWLTGVFLLLSYFLVLYLKERKRLRRSIPAQNGTAERLIHNMSRHRKVRLYTSEQFSTPVTYGILFPKIILPVNLDTVSRVDLRNMIAHELVHIRRLDVAKRFFLAAALCLHWFNPLIWVMYYLYQEDQEISCDEQVLKKMGNEEAKNYIYTMIKMAAGGKRLLVTTGFGGKDAGRKRILEAMNQKKMGKCGALTAFVFGFVLLLSFVSLRVPAGEYKINKDMKVIQAMRPKAVKKELAQLNPVFDRTYSADALFSYDEEDFDYYAVYNDIVENYNDFSQELTEEQIKAIIVKESIHVAELAKERLDKGLELDAADLWLIDEYYNFKEKYPNPYAE